MELDFTALRELIAALNQTDVTEFNLKSGDFELVIRKGTAPTSAMLPVAVTSPVAAPPPPPLLPSAIATAPAPSPAVAPPPHGNDKLLEITSPMVGTFYRAPGPEEDPYVNKGDRIRKGQAVCIIEAMKLMNELESEVAGEVVEILVENGQPVEFGQVLMRVNPG